MIKLIAWLFGIPNNNNKIEQNLKALDETNRKVYNNKSN